MDLRHFSYFLAVAEAGSFSAAARRVHVSQPALSARLKDLEEEIGVELFSRHARGVVLTKAGRQLLPHAREVRDAVNRAKAVFQEQSRSSLLVGLTPTLGLYFLPELLQTCSSESDIDPIVHQASSAVLMSMLEGSRLDFILSLGLPPEHPTIVGRFFEEDLVLVGRPGVLNLSGREMEFDMLQNFSLVVEPEGHLVRRMIDEIASKRGIHLTISAEVEPVAAKLALLMRSNVCTIAPEWVFRNELRAGVLEACRIYNPALVLKLHLASRKSVSDEALFKFKEVVWSTVKKLSHTESTWRLNTRESI